MPKPISINCAAGRKARAKAASQLQPPRPSLAKLRRGWQRMRDLRRELSAKAV